MRPARTRSRPGETDTTWRARPALAPGVEVVAPAEPGAPWVMHRGRSYVRVGVDLARLAEGLDGSSDHATIAARLGAPWTAEAVDLAVTRLHAAGFIEDGRRRRERHRRVEFVPPLSLQVTIVRPGAGLERVARRLPTITSARTWAAALAVVGVGLVALVLQAEAVVEALSTPVPWQSLVVLLLVVGLATTLHELSHGVALLQEGGRPSRIGWMLFYLAPAMFCDVSDAWRLPRPVQRVRVALVGVVTQAMVGAGCAAAAALPVPGPVRDLLLLVAVGSYAVGVLNLVPLMKLDGYIALMSHLDRPNLRTLCIDQARSVTAWLLFGGRRPVRGPGVPSWATAFGAASVMFPWYVAVSVLALYVALLSRAGPVGLAVLLVAAVYLVALLVQGVRRLVGAGRRNGARRRRVAAVLTAGAGALGLVLTTVQVPYRVPATYVEAEGVPLVVVPEGVAVPDLPAGAPVEVLRAGVVLSRSQASGVLTGPVEHRVEVPAAAFLPIVVDSDVTIPAHAWLVDLDGADPDGGVALVDAGERRLGHWLYLTYLAVGIS